MRFSVSLRQSAMIDKLLFIAGGDLDLVRNAIFANPDLSAIVAYIVKHRTNKERSNASEPFG